MIDRVKQFLSALKDIVALGVGLLIAIPIMCLGGTLLLMEWSFIRIRNASRIMRAYRSRSDYVLLLGSFARAIEDEKATGHVKYEGESERPVDLSKLDRKLRSAEEILDGCSLPCLRIGGKRHKATLTFAVSDKYWFKTFGVLAGGARALLVLPGASQSLLREMTQIKADHSLLKKTIVAVPPAFEIDDDDMRALSAYRPFWRRDADDVPGSTRSAEWPKIRGEIYNSTGIRLPSSADNSLLTFESLQRLGPCDAQSLNEAIDKMAPGLPLSFVLRSVRTRYLGEVKAWLRGYETDLSERQCQPCDLNIGGAQHRFEGHTNWISHVIALSDGKRAVSASADRTFKLWDLTSGAVLRTFEVHPYGLNGLTALPDGQRVVSTSHDTDDGALNLWDLTSGEAKFTLKCNSFGSSAVTVMPDGQGIIFAHRNALKLVDLSGTPHQTLEGHTGFVKAVAVMPDGQRVVSASYDKTLRLWDLASGATIRIFEGHADVVNAVAVLSGGQRFISASRDKTLKVWDLASGAVLKTFEGHADEVDTLTPLPDGRRVISASEKAGTRHGTIKVWDLTSGTLVQTFEGMRGVTLLPDGQRIISLSQDGTSMLWDATSGTVLQKFGRDIGWIIAVTALPDGQRALTGDSEGALTLWALESGVALRRM